MTNPWDRPPFPTSGDDSDDSTYAGVGRVISQWEDIELGLSRLYAEFIGRPFSVETYGQYHRSAKTSKQRITSVAATAGGFFQKYPDQAVEGEFCGLIKKLNGFSKRRHEVAHGFVRPFYWYRIANQNNALPSHPRMQYCVVPPYYQRDWFDENEMPRYVYTSKELSDLERLLFELGHEIIDFRVSLFPKQST